LNEEAWSIRNSNTERALELSLEAYGISVKLNFNYGTAYSLRNLAVCNQLLSNHQTSLKYCFEAVPLFEMLKEDKGMASVYSCIGTDYFLLNDYQNSLLYHLKALKLREQISSTGQASSLFNIASVYASIRDYGKALDYYLRSEKIARELEDQTIWAKVLNGHGGMHMVQFDHEKAIECYLQSIHIKKQTGDLRSTASTLHNMGDCYIELNDFDNAQECLMESMKIAVKFGDRSTEGACLFTIGRLFLVRRFLEEAIDQMKRALFIFEDISAKKEQANCHKLLSDTYVLLTDYKTAIYHLNKHFQLKEKLSELESAKKIENMILLRQIEVMKSESEIEQLKNAELKAAYQQIEDKNRDILASIEYAKYIQETLLPSKEDIQQSFPDAFIFFKPKDIVSGDFCFHYRLGDMVLIAVVDCTGHGVPGAFMSLAANNMIDHIVKVKGIHEPGRVLMALNNAIAELFKNDDEMVSLKNGMDIAFCSIDLVTLELNYAGARNSIYILRSDELIELKAERIAMGNTLDQAFEQQVFSLRRNDFIYLFSDGFADQKGGEKRLKFYYPPFKELLQSMGSFSIPEQKTILDRELNMWMKNETQTDDITILGIRI
jgi:serine phosphatase RsbU (regulator of sigma subunit)